MTREPMINYKIKGASKRMARTKKILMAETLPYDVAPRAAKPHMRLVAETPASIPEHDHFIAVNEYGFYSIPQAFADRDVPTLLRD